MNRKKKFLGLFLIMGSIAVSGCQKNKVDTALKTNDLEMTITPQVTITPQLKEPSVTITPAQDNSWVTQQKDSILQQKPEYKDYAQYSFQLGNANIIVFEVPGSDKEDWLNYFADLWAYGKDWVLPVEEGAWIVPNSFGVENLNGREYFRYDRSYATESATVMVMLDEKDQLRVIPLMGALKGTSGNDITITQSSYDMTCLKGTDMGSGHTWKPRYYYFKDYEVYEYLATDLSEEDFLQYQGAREIIEKIKKEYQKPELKLNIEYQKRENGLIHANISLEAESDYTFYYETYIINEDQSLSLLDFGEGTYGQFPEAEFDSESENITDIEASVIAEHGSMDQVIDTKFVKFTKVNNTIKVRNIEWLSPWSEEDRPRIQQLLDQGKIKANEDIWDMEFYIYTDPKDESVYQLAEDAKILVFENGLEYKYYDISKLGELEANRLFTIYVKGDIVYLMSEIYTP